jgi:predicted transcriptional regulator
MERDLIFLALQEIIFRDGKDLKEVQQYLRMKYRMEVDELVLKRRLEKLIKTEKAVA